MPKDILVEEQVETALRRASKGDRPQDSDLFPVYNFLLPSNADVDHHASSATSSRAETHWYCPKAPSALHTAAATYLIFLFAYKRDGMPKKWLNALEGVLKGCERCARAFGGARRRFASKYLGTFPNETRKNFFLAVDKWQLELIVVEVKAAGQSNYVSTFSHDSILSLSTPILQLLFSEPSLLDHVSLASLLDVSIAAAPTKPCPGVYSLGLTPVLVHLLSSPNATRRVWAEAQLPGHARRPLSFDEWCSSGVGSQIQLLYNGTGDISQAARWRATEMAIRSKALSLETIEKGLISGKLGDGNDKPSRGLACALSHQLGSEQEGYEHILGCFSFILRLTPTSAMWEFDPTPELPHTLFSEIKNNPSYQSLLSHRYPDDNASSTAESEKSGKGKEKEESIDSPLGWITNFLISLIDSPQGAKESAFPEALARVMVFCFAEMQHERLNDRLRAAAAKVGFDTFITLRRQIPEQDSVLHASLNSILDVHAEFIANIALRSQAMPQVWEVARNTARDLLSQFFVSDGRDIVGCVLGLAHVAYVEKRRLKKARTGKDVQPPLPVDKLHLVAVRRELWRATYEAISPRGAPSGVAIFINSIATFAHIEKLDRKNAWTEKGLEAVIKEDDWIAAIRAINAALQATRDSFPRVLESFARQPDPDAFRTLWQIPGLAKSATILLLSPIDEIHSVALDLISQSFPDVDDRADCFRILLQKYPIQAMDGLTTFLGDFVDTASKTPDSCSLAKWLVRCFTDILECLCTPSEDSEPLLQSDNFLTAYADGKAMSRRLSDLWQLMTESLTVIFDRTKDWAPLYDNETMVDWMRDALIFGRLMIDNIRIFESAVLGHAQAQRDFTGESPSKSTSVGKTLIKRFEKVLKHAVSWLRLTDVETLHQTFELVKTILERIVKSQPSLSDAPDLETTLHDIDKFSRKAGKNYRTRLSDDLLSELSDLLSPFDLGLGDDEVQFVSDVPKPVAPQPSAQPPSTSVKRNVFDEMMKSAGKAKETSVRAGTHRAAPPKASGSSKQQAIDIDDFDDGFLDQISAQDLEIMEKRAKVSTNLPKPPVTQAQLPIRPKPSAQAAKISVNVVPRPAQKPSGSTFKSKFMQEARREHRHQAVVTQKAIGGIVPKLPVASGLGSGLGAFTGDRRKIQPVESSGSSASDSSDEENKGVKALVGKQKSPVKRFQIPEPRQIKVLGTSLADVMRQRDDRRASQYAIKQRLRPDLSPLYRHVLGWDPTHTGPNAPHHPKLAAGLSAMGPVPTTFPSAQRYEQVMLPLFLQELWQQCLKDTPSGLPVNVEISSRTYEDDFIDMEVVVQGAMPHDFYVNDTDVVILRQAGAPRPVFAKVQGFKRKFKDTGMKLRILSQMDMKELSGRSKWLLNKHVSLSTAIREFAALKGLPYYEPTLLQDVLAGKAAPMPRLVPAVIEDAQKAYDVNEPQARAILGAMNTNGFALIQGPPGTGKTKTISGLVGKFLSERSTAIPMHGEKPTKTKLLVCAPSNAAVDEVCKRLMNGVPSSSGSRIVPSIVRIGIEASVNAAVKDIALESLVEAQVNASSNGASGGGDYARIQSELNEVKEKIREKQDQLKEVQGHDEKRRAVEGEYHALITRRTQLGQQSSKAKDAARDATRHLEGARRAAKDAILSDADIICATLSGAGQDILSPYTFETVIIDEAAQAIEMSCLIPLKYGCRRCIMVGDPNQLPPTTFSSDAERFHYNESLFVRIVRRDPSNVHLLSIQYRMHPFISELPSKVFYGGRLTDGPDMAGKTAAVWHQRNVFGPYRFFNVEGMEQKAGTSTRNVQEALVAVELYRRLEADFGSKVNLAMRIGIISMYKEQLWELKRKFTEAFGRNILDLIEFNTVDGFQGQEKDIIILSCVRSGNLRSIGFLKDPRRMNVALTRAKSSLFVIGNGATLESSDERWKTIVGDARDRGFFVNYTASTFAAETPAQPAPPKPKNKKEVPSSPTATGLATSDKAVPPKVLVAEQSHKRKHSVGGTTTPIEGKKRKSDVGPNGTAQTKPSPSSGSNGQRVPPAGPKPSTHPNGNIRPAQSSAGPSKAPTQPNGASRPSYPPTSRPPPPSGPPPPAPPPRSAEDILFIKKKKKNKNKPGLPANGSSAR